MTPPETREVVLADVPVAMFWRLQRHHDEVLREFSLIDIDRSYGGADAVPAKLLDLVTALRSRYATERDALMQALGEAAAREEVLATVRLRLPVAAADILEATCRTFEEADEFCRSGHLLTLAIPDDMAAFRRGLCNQILRQLRS